MDHKTTPQNIFTVHVLILSACIVLLLQNSTRTTATCTSSAVTFFNARPVFACPGLPTSPRLLRTGPARQASSGKPASAPRTSGQLWHKKKHTRFAHADLVDIRTINPHIMVELRYASNNNFTGKKIYKTNTCYLKKATALKLNSVQKELELQGLGLKIWDGYRPPAAQKKLWKLVPDPRYVAPPEKGSRHTRGCSVDVTLVTSSGKELAMPTAFDDFSEKAQSNYQALPADVIKNRELLKKLMIKYGFMPVASEWWHFDDADWKTCPLLNISI